MNFNEILYGVAYYDEYMPYDRIETLPNPPGAHGSLRREYLILHTCTVCLTAQQNIS